MPNHRIRPEVSLALRPAGFTRYLEASNVPQIGTKLMKFKPPAPGPRNTDIRGYRLRVAVDSGAGSASKYELPFTDLGKPATDAQGFVVIDLGAIPATAGLDGVFDVAVTAYDDATPSPNESAFLALENANVDFVPPDPPTDLQLG